MRLMRLDGDGGAQQIQEVEGLEGAWEAVGHYLQDLQDEVTYWVAGAMEAETTNGLPAQTCAAWVCESSAGDGFVLVMTR